MKKKYYLVHSVVDPRPEKILKILKDGYLYASKYTKQYGIYHGEYLDHVYLSLFGDEKVKFGSYGVTFIIDAKILFDHSFRYALNWVGDDLKKTIEVNYKYNDVDGELDKINQHIISMDEKNPNKTTSHEILIKKKINLHEYLVAMCCSDTLTVEIIDYLHKNYPNTIILDEIPDSANELCIVLNKKKWLDEINELAYEGQFEKAKELIESGKKENFILTKKDATEILASVGVDVRYWFIKPLVDIGGKFQDSVIEFAKQVLKSTESEGYRIWKTIPDAIEGFKLVLEVSKSNNKMSHITNNRKYFMKYQKYKHKYLLLKNN
jgi:hypothetical protein